MSVASWIYDHAPERVRDWMEQRTLDREAAERQDAEAASVFADRRKYNIEHGIPLTPPQQEEQHRVDRLFERETATAPELFYRAHFRVDEQSVVVPHGNVWLVAPNDRSLDSRYLGPFSTNSIIGVATPLLVE